MKKFGKIGLNRAIGKRVKEEVVQKKHPKFWMLFKFIK